MSTVGSIPPTGAYERLLPSAPLNIPVSSQLLPPPPYIHTTNTNTTITATSSTTNNNMNNFTEEISTIFVVGFPEDMQEREFQNMFTFCSGFEAATLKIPNKENEEDTTSSNNNNNKKQTIGFAKFRTRQEAIEARDIISGRKVDADKGSVLKAEMAKKNLHTKRGLSNDIFQPNQQQQSLLILPPPPLPPSQQQHQVQPNPIIDSQQLNTITTTSSSTTKRPFGPLHSSIYEAFHSVPASDPTSPDIYSDMFTHHGNTSILPINTTNTTNTSSNSININSRNAFNSNHRFSSNNIFEAIQSPDGLNSPNNGSYFNLMDHHPSSLPTFTTNITTTTNNNNNNDNNNNISTTNSINLASSHSQQQQQALQQQHPSLHNQHQSLDTNFGNLTINTSSSLNNHNHIHSHNNSNNIHNNSNNNNSNSNNNNNNNNNTPISTSPTSIISSNGPLSPGLLSPNSYQSFASMVGNLNPVDQNPPCNTLYVGNLPPNTNEEELKQLFSKCIGYKRLSFRQKSNGPMCFVEFEDIYCASQALQDLYGNPLSNSVKGGIRLSFSKNPLGVRQNSITNTSCNASLTNSLFLLPYHRDSLTFDPSFS